MEYRNERYQKNIQESNAVYVSRSRLSSLDSRIEIGSITVDID